MLKVIHHSRLHWWDFWFVVLLLLGLSYPVAETANKAKSIYIYRTAINPRID